MVSQTELENAADRCVKCGMCLQVCPTYRLSQNESNSPRGRISIVQGVLKNQLYASVSLNFHLDSCLQCRLCENRCPSAVPIVNLVQEMKRHLDSSSSKPKISIVKRVKRSVALTLLTAPRFVKLAASHLLYLYQKLKLTKLLKFSGIFLIPSIARLDDYLPKMNRPIRWKEYYPAQNTQSGHVALFLGCVSQVLDSDTVNASISLLTKLGYAVSIPKNQTCCGALHFHQGDNKNADTCTKRNILAFNSNHADVIVNLATGCDKFINQYPGLDPFEHAVPKQQNPSSFAVKSQHIVQFLAKLQWPENIVVDPSDSNTAIHIPCTQSTQMQAQDVHKIVNKIPNIKVTTLVQDTCCGAAGSYMMEFPQQSDKIRASLLSEISDATQILMTSNIGCALHLSTGLRHAKSNCEVLHPVTLLDRQVRVVPNMTRPNKTA